MKQTKLKKLILMSAVVVTVFSALSPAVQLLRPAPIPLPPIPTRPTVAIPAPRPAVIKTPAPPPAIPNPAPTETKPELPSLATAEEPHPVYPYTALMNPSGTLYSMEPFWNRLSAPAGWNAINATNGAPVIAVIDTGFAMSHQDLQSRWTTARWDFIHNDGSPDAGQTNPNGASAFHGTMTAGLASLINPNVRLMPLQALDDDGSGNTNTVAAAVQYAVAHGANIISLSLGSTFDDTYLRQQIDAAIAQGVLVVAAAGNNGTSSMVYPAAYPEVLSVGADDASDNRASFSSYGTNLDVVAPGVAGDICSTVYLSTNTTSAYSCGYSGTSFATPMVAGLAGLLLNQDPGATPSDLMRFITQNADKTPSMGGADRSLQQGYGRIDIYRSVLAASLANPGGDLINKRSISLTSADPSTSPSMDTSCTGVAGSACTITLVGPSGQTISLGTKTLDGNGAAEFIWNAATTGLTPGVWQVKASLAAFGQTAIRQVDSISVSP